MKAERVESSLYPRFWSFNREENALMRQIVVLTDGSGEVELGERRMALEAPALLWLGEAGTGRLRVEAGATGYRGSVSAGMLGAAVGDEPDSHHLHALVERNFVLSFAGQAERLNVVDRCFTTMVNEARQPQHGSPLILSALLRIVLVVALRVSGGEEIGHAAGGGASSLLQRFRQLVEMNFRNHWTVARYARTLGVSTDRLHAVCTRGLGKSPKALISERLANEALLRLERSSMTIEQFGHSLGFNDPAHFSSFFKRMTGMTPGSYRASAMQSRARGQAAPPQGFSDWP